MPLSLFLLCLKPMEMLRKLRDIKFESSTDLFSVSHGAYLYKSFKKGSGAVVYI